MESSPDLVKELAELERLTDLYCRREPVDEANASVRRAVEEFNAWVERANAGSKAERAALEARLPPIREAESSIEALDDRLQRERPDGTDARAVETFNRLVGERNDLVRRHREMAEGFTAAQEAYAARVDRLNEEIAARREGVEALKREAEASVDAYREWRSGSGLEGLWSRTNRLHAALCRQAREAGHLPEDAARAASAVRRLRADLADQAAKREAANDDGFLLAPATLCRSEPALLMVDTGASVVSLSEEMVDVLGIREFVGEEVELRLAGGLRIRAPQLLIPSLTVYGMEAPWVKGIVLKEPMPGVDGCLGMSFLSRFDYSIVRGRPRPLELGRPEPREQATGFDVFISHKSEDFDASKRIYDALKAEGYRVFLSEITIEEMRTTDFEKAIDTALEDAEHLVVVCSSKGHVEAPWVQTEWRMFLNLVRSGQKEGNVLTILCGGMAVADLPLALRHYQAIPMEDPRLAEKLVNLLPRGQ